MEHEQITNLADDIDDYCEKNGLEICTMNAITILQERGLLVSQIDCQVKPANDDNWHKCKYCGTYTEMPDDTCYKNPKWKQETSGR